MPAPTAASTTDLLTDGTASQTLSGLVRRVLNRVEDDAYTDTHSDAPSDSATSITIASGGADRYSVGATLDWTDDGTFEAAVVTAVADTSLTIRRGHRGTTAAAHSANAVFRMEPRFLSHVISDVVTESIQNLWPDIYLVQESTFTLPAAPIDRWYALPAGTQDILDVYQYDTSVDPNLRRSVNSFSQVMTLDTTNFTTGLGFYINGINDAAGDIHVIHTSKVAVSSLTDTQADIVVYDTAATLLEMETSHRKQDQRRSFIFDAGSKISLLRRQAQRLRMNEKSRLQGFLPRRDQLHFRQRRHYFDGATVGSDER